METPKNELEKAIRKWLYFGALLFAFEVTFGIIILYFVPKIRSLYQELDVALSGGIQILLSLNSFLLKNPTLVTLILGLILGGQILIWYHLYQNGVGPRFVLRSGLIEPVTMILLGLTIGFLITITLLPIYSLITQF